MCLDYPSLLCLSDPYQKSLCQLWLLCLLCNPLSLIRAVRMDIGLEPDRVTTQLKASSAPPWICQEQTVQDQCRRPLSSSFIQTRPFNITGTFVILARNLTLWVYAVEDAKLYQKNFTCSWISKHLLISFLPHQTALKAIQCFALSKPIALAVSYQLLSMLLLEAKQLKLVPLFYL